MDLRRWGSEYEKKYVQLTQEDIDKVAENYHNWQQTDYTTTYKDVPEFCKSASLEDLKANDYSLVPSKYIEFVDRDSGIDFDTEMKRIQQDFKTCCKKSKTHKTNWKAHLKRWAMNCTILKRSNWRVLNYKPMNWKMKKIKR